MRSAAHSSASNISTVRFYPRTESIQKKHVCIVLSTERFVLFLTLQVRFQIDWLIDWQWLWRRPGSDQSDQWPLAGQRASIVLQAAALAARPETLPWCTVPCHARRLASQYRGPWSHGCCHELITNIANMVLPLLQFRFKRAREREISLFAIAHSSKLVPWNYFVTQKSPKHLKSNGVKLQVTS